jgi:redox-sensitive bicupin YhaK (pirin superfamily)
MEKYKIIGEILSPPGFHWVGNGFKVHNFFPGGYDIVNKISPFYLLDYNAKMNYKPSNEKRGVGVHPHRGLETVTIAYHGKVAHHDSAGNSGIISEGDVQWMTAGKGILHKEYHESGYVKEGGDFQMVQLWVNLPAKYKMSEPKYQEIPNSGMKKFEIENKGGIINIIAGEYKSIKGTAKTFTPINLFDVRLNKNGKTDFEFAENHNTGLLIIEGKIKINNIEIVNNDHFVLFKNEGTKIEIEALENSTILIMSGEPINELITQSGPFLMNTEQEIRQAYEDFKMGKFGYLED